MNLLFVDDLEDSAVALSMLFDTRGHSTFVATTLSAALDVAESTALDVVVLDLGIPSKRAGLEACRLLRQLDTVIVVVSGWTKPSDRIAALAAGADCFLLKPASLSEIESAIKRGRRRRGSLRYVSALETAQNNRAG